MITGFLELASPHEMRGWAYDQAEPGAHLSVEVLCGARTIGRVQADLYRRDLEAAGVGQGDHAFVLRCDPALTEADLSLVSARVNCPGRLVHVLPWLVDAPERKLSLSPISWPGPASDLEHHPVFILGAARSGTSAVAHALLAAAGYEGNEEGHLFDILAPLAAGARRFDDSKADERLAGRNTTVARVPPVSSMTASPLSQSRRRACCSRPGAGWTRRRAPTWCSWPPGSARSGRTRALSS